MMSICKGMYRGTMCLEGCRALSTSVKLGNYIRIGIRVVGKVFYEVEKTIESSFSRCVNSFRCTVHGVIDIL